jgi:hypothetical protein
MWGTIDFSTSTTCGCGSKVGDGVVQRDRVRVVARHAVRLARPSKRPLDDLAKGLPVAQHLVEAIGAEDVQEGRHPFGWHALLEQGLRRRTHREVDERAVAVEADESGVECHSVFHCVLLLPV